MKVRAIRLGYYNHLRRREGVEFALKKDSDFSSRWMEKVEEEEAEAKPSARGKAKAKPAPEDDSDSVI